MTMIPMIQQGDIIPRSPSSQLRLYSGVPWTNRYDHVRLYNNQTDLLSNLETWRVSPSTQLNNLAPIRVGDYEVRVPFTEMSALKINYAAFQNTGISSEWVFCFVTNIRWRSENTTILTLELDVFQNNFYSISMKPCLIEYQHIARSEDVIGGNLVPVGLETGEMIVDQYTGYPLTNFHICAYATEGTTGADFDGKICNNVYRAASLWHMPISDSDAESSANTLIETYNDAGKIDAIIALFMSPDICVNVVSNPSESKDNISLSIPTDIDGYTPKNKKLFSYPWCYVIADNNEGNTAIYRWELSGDSNHSLNFLISGALATMPQVMCTPTNYKNSSVNYNESLIVSGFPICAYSSDTFRAWIAQNKASLAVSAGTTALNVVSGAVKTAGAIAAAPVTAGLSTAIVEGSGIAQTTGGLSNALNLLAQVEDKQRVPATSHGKALSENINAALNITGYSFYSVTCNAEFAEIADDFFEMFGYPINKVQMPNITNRSTWNYIKTQGCGFTGACTLDELAQIRAIFDTGVTVWHTNDVGNYSLTNN